MKALYEKLLFLYKFTKSPKQIGSVTPSSGLLAMKMLKQIPWTHVDAVAELGAGTGAITRHLDKVRRKETKVVLFEKDPGLLNKLEARFPEYACHTDACKLREALDQENIDQLDCIISGLPFFNFPQPMRDLLLDQIVSSLRPGGLFIAFQYSQQMKMQLFRHFHIRHVHFVLLNVPPAFVYVCEKGEDSAGNLSQRPYIDVPS